MSGALYINKRANVYAHCWSIRFRVTRCTCHINTNIAHRYSGFSTTSHLHLLSCLLRQLHTTLSAVSWSSSSYLNLTYHAATEASRASPVPGETFCIYCGLTPHHRLTTHRTLSGGHYAHAKLATSPDFSSCGDGMHHIPPVSLTSRVGRSPSRRLPPVYYHHRDLLPEDAMETKYLRSSADENASDLLSSQIIGGSPQGRQPPKVKVINGNASAEARMMTDYLVSLE